MRVKSLLVFGMLLLVALGTNAQVKNDTLPVFLADSINTVYIYADTGTALNKVTSEGKKKGLWVKKYPDGHIRYKGHFRDDHPYGIFKYYYDQGDSLEGLYKYSDDGKTAYAQIFYTTGALWGEGKFVNQKEDSIWKFYDDMQRLIRKDQFKKGKKNGKSVIFYPEDGNPLEIKNWRNDTAEGPYQQFYDEGGVKEEGTYRHGMMEDTCYIYDLDGKIAIKGTYYHDMHDGMWIHYYDGAPKDTLIYEKSICVNCYKYQLNQRQTDSLEEHYQELQQQLDNPGSNPNKHSQTQDLDPSEFH